MKEKGISKPEKGAPHDGTEKYPRIPCRGCTHDCRHYSICDGRPWRTLTPDNTSSEYAVASK